MYARRRAGAASAMIAIAHSSHAVVTIEPSYTVAIAPTNSKRVYALIQTPDQG